MPKWLSPKEVKVGYGISEPLLRRQALNGAFKQGTDYIVVSKRGDRRYSSAAIEGWLEDRGVAAAC
jgi:hypothetical protein